MRFISVALVACLGLAACTAANTPAPVSNTTVAVTSPAVVADKTLLDEQAMYAAEALYNVPAQAYVVADTNGKLSPAVKAQVKPKLVSAYEYLKLARTAYLVGNSRNFFAAIANLKTLSDQATALLPKVN